MISRVDDAILATAFTRSGSNRAVSSSFARARATFTPSVDPGGALAPPENAWPMTSFSLFVDLDKYRDSIFEIDRNTRTVSGLESRINALVVNTRVNTKNYSFTFGPYWCKLYLREQLSWQKIRETAAAIWGIHD
jgi:hypothetical protein